MSHYDFYIYISVCVYTNDCYEYIYIYIYIYCVRACNSDTPHFRSITRWHFQMLSLSLSAFINNYPTFQTRETVESKLRTTKKICRIYIYIYIYMYIYIYIKSWREIIPGVICIIFYDDPNYSHFIIAALHEQHNILIKEEIYKCTFDVAK